MVRRRAGAARRRPRRSPPRARCAAPLVGCVASWPGPPSNGRRCPSAATIAAGRLPSAPPRRMPAPWVSDLSMNRAILRALLALALVLAAVPSAAGAVTRVTPAGWAVRPAGAEISVSRSVQGFQGPLGSALSPSGQKLISVSSAAARINSADLFDLRRRRRTGTVPYDSRRGESAFYGVTFSPGGKYAWASGGGQNVVHVYAVGKKLREVGQIPTPFFPAGLAY